MRQMRWTKAEINLLSSGLSDYEIAKKTGRTLRAVQSKRSRVHMEMGLSTPIEYIRIPPVVGQSGFEKTIRIKELAGKLGVRLGG